MADHRLDPESSLTYLPPKQHLAGSPRVQREVESEPGYPGGDTKIKAYTPQQQKELLASYVKVPQEYWHMFKSGDHIRYYDIDGNFHTGGYIDRVILEYVPKGKTQSLTHMKLVKEHSVATKNYSWNVRYDRFKDIYLRPDVATFLVQKEMAEAIKVLQNNLEKLAALVKST